jgi:hypothetical protein
MDPDAFLSSVLCELNRAQADDKIIAGAIGGTDSKDE